MTAETETERDLVDRLAARRPRGVLDRPLTLLVVAQAAWLWWVYSRGWFFQADLSNLVDGLDQPLDWGYLTSPLGGHFAPVGRLVYWLFDELSPLDYGLSVALRVGFQAASTVLLHRLLSTLVRNRPIVLAVVAVYAFNPLLLVGTAMFTPGILLVSGQTLTLLALLAHVRHEQGGPLRWAAAAGLLLAAATLCSEQWALAALAFPLLSLIHFYPGPIRARVGQFVRAWRVWVLIVAPIVVAGIGTLAFAEPTGAATPSLEVSYRLLRNSWLYSIAPSWIGGPLQWFGDATTYIPTSAPSDLVVLLGQIGVALTVLVGVQRNGRRSLAAWVLPLAVWVVSMLLVGYRGFSQLQDLVSITPRYLDALIPFFALGAALALAPGGVAPSTTMRPPVEETPPAEEVSLEETPPPRRVDPQVAVAGVLVVALLATSVVSGVRFADIYRRLPAEQYLQNLGDTARAAGSSLNVYDTAVPPELISPVEPNHRVTDLLRLTGARFTVNGPATTPLVAAADGRLVRSVFVPAGAVVTLPPCGAAVHGAGTVTFALNRAVPKADWYLHLQLFQQAPSTVTVEVIDSAGHVAAPVTGSVLHLGSLASLSMRLPTFAPTAVRFRSRDASTSLCLTAIQVGAPFPAPGA